jgi:hypothetical protein
MMSSSKNNEIKIVPTEEQFYTRAETETLITKPMKGSLLLITGKKGSRFSKSSNSSQNSVTPDQIFDSGELFVVVNVDYKSRGVNKGIVDSCALNKVISISDNNLAIYDSSNTSMYLFLTNHGKWFGSEQLKGNDYIWDPDYNKKKSEDKKEIPADENFRRSSPISIGSASLKPKSSVRNSEPSNFVHDGGGLDQNVAKETTSSYL